MSVVSSLYRSLLRTAKKFDASPMKKAFLVRKFPKIAYNRATNTWENLGVERDDDVEEVWDTLLGDSATFYLPDDSSSIAQHITLAFRKGSFDELNRGFTALKLLNDAYNKATLHEDMIHATSSSSSESESSSSSLEPSSSLPTDTDTASTGSGAELLRLQPNEMSIASELKGGILLLTHPLSVEPCFGRSVLLLAEHDKQNLGSMAFILNKPANTQLHQLTSPMPSEMTTALQVFKDQSLYLGGPCESLIACIHTFDELEEVSRQICPGLYYGGQECIEQANVLVKDGYASPSDFKFVSGTALWGKHQLLGEVGQKHWILAEPTDPLTLQQIVLQQITPDQSEGQGPPESELILGHKQVPTQGAQLWGSILTNLGGEYAEFASLAGIQQQALDNLLKSEDLIK